MLPPIRCKFLKVRRLQHAAAIGGELILAAGRENDDPYTLEHSWKTIALR